MNKNTKADRARLARAKGTITCTRAKTQQGLGAGKYVLVNYTLNYGTQKRKSRDGHGKVAGTIRKN